MAAEAADDGRLLIKIPFGVYDFFGYLASGGVVLSAIDLLRGGQLLTAATVPPGLAILLLLAAYVVGHAVAHLAGVILESLLVGRVLGPSEDVITATQDSRSRWRLLFPGYFKRMPADMISRVRALAESQSAGTSGRALFLHCHAIVRQQAPTLERLNTFLALYGFCRNLAMATLVSATLVAAARFGAIPGFRAPTPFSAIMTGCLALVYLLLLRYLKFYRLYTVEVFSAFSVTRA